MSLDFPILLGAVIAATFLSDALFKRTRIPDAVSLTGIGIVLGRALPIEVSGSMRSFMSSFGSLALAVILFQTGLKLDLKRLSHQAGRTILLALFSFAFATFLLYCAFVIGLEFHGPKAWAVAAALACTSGDIILPSLAKAKPGQALSSLLSTEAALSSVLAVIVVLVLTSHGETAVFDAALWEGRGVSFLSGGGIALVMGILWLRLRPRLAQNKFFYLFTLGFVFLLLGVMERSGSGSGAFAVLLFGAILANGDSIVESLPPGLRKYMHMGPAVDSMSAAMGESHDQILFFVRGFFYLFLGLLFEWPGLDLRIWLGIVVAAVAVILAREVSVQLAGWTALIPGHDRALLRLSTPRGLTTAVLVAIVLPWAGSGPWQTMAIAVVLVSNLRLSIGAAKLSRDASRRSKEIGR
jgi:NhaP-type Na+/H+ or K+/H+ antiporter